MRRWITALIVLGMAGAGVVAAAPAAKAANPSCLVVDATSDQSYPSLQAAVDAAAAGDTLFVKGTCTGNTVITEDLTITGQSNGGAKTATLDGGGASSVLSIFTTTDITVTLNTLIITNAVAFAGIADDNGTVTLNNSTVTGTATTAPPNSGTQGGIFNNGGTVTLNNSSVTGNNAGAFGGGISNRGTVILNNSTVSGNTVRGDGGGIYNEGTVTLNGSSTITGNTAGGDGGGIDNSCGTLNGAVPGTGGNVYNNTPGDIFNEPC
jgi:hypothetical protein